MKKTLLFAVCALLCGSMAFATTTESAASDKTDAAKTQTEGKKKKQVHLSLSAISTSESSLYLYMLV